MEHARIPRIRRIPIAVKYLKMSHREGIHVILLQTIELFVRFRKLTSSLSEKGVYNNSTDGDEKSWGGVKFLLEIVQVAIEEVFV